MERNNAIPRERAGSGDAGLRLLEANLPSHVEPSTKASTIQRRMVFGHKAIWRQHLSLAFAGINLVD
jgi:hypothetical protein